MFVVWPPPSEKTEGAEEGEGAEEEGEDVKVKTEVNETPAECGREAGRPFVSCLCAGGH